MGVTLDDIGRCNDQDEKNPEAIKGGYISFYITCINAVYHAEKLIIREIIRGKTQQNAGRKYKSSNRVDKSILKYYTKLMPLLRLAPVRTLEGHPIYCLVGESPTPFLGDGVSYMNSCSRKATNLDCSL